MNFIRQTIKRLKSNTPSYFKKLRAACLWYVGAGAAMVGAVEMLHLLPPEPYYEILKYTIVGATFLSFGASVTTTDPNLRDKENG